MNDALTGTLTLDWQLPAYARDHLWLETPLECVQTSGAHGDFALSHPADALTIRWGGADGAALARVLWRVDSLEWDGRACVGGYIDAMHIAPIDTDEDEERALVLLMMGGMPLQPGITPYLTAAQRSRTPYVFPSFEAGLCNDLSETLTTWLALDGSPLLTLAQDALVSKLRVYAFGRLAHERAGWDRAAALPLVLEALTLFAP